MLGKSSAGIFGAALGAGLGAFGDAALPPMPLESEAFVEASDSVPVHLEEAVPAPSDRWDELLEQSEHVFAPGRIDYQDNYRAAYQQAKAERKLLAVVFESESAAAPAAPKFIASSGDYVWVRLPVDYQHEINGNPITLIEHSSFSALNRKPGVAIINLRDAAQNFSAVVASCSMEILNSEAAAGTLNSGVTPYQGRLIPLNAQAAEQGASFVENSAALALHRKIHERLAQSGEVSSRQIVEFFHTLSTETGTQVGPDLVRHYGTLVKEDSTAASAVLQFLRDSRYITGSFGFLKPYLEGPSAGVTARALLVLEKTPEEQIPQELLARLAAHTDLDVRAAAASCRMSRGQDTGRLTPLEILATSLMLSESSRTSGNEVRLGMKLAEHYGTLGTEDSRYLALPVLRFMQAVELRYPGWLEALHARDPKLFDQFNGKVFQMTLDHRRELENQTLFGPGIKVVAALHTEDIFKPNSLKEFAARYGMSFEGHYRGSAGNYLASNPKQGYLDAAAALAANQTQPAVLWQLMHGGPDHFWFDNGQAGVDSSADLRNPYSVSWLELAETLVKAQLKAQENAAQPPVVDLSHLRLMFDCCQQYTVATQFHDEVFRIAEQSNAEVRGLPTIVVISQRRMYGQVTARGTEGNMLAYSQVADALLELVPQQGATVTIGDVLKAERGIAAKLYNLIKNPALLDGIKEIDCQDPAVFSPRLWDLDQELDQIVCELETNWDLPERGLGRQIPRTQQSVLEVGR